MGFWQILISYCKFLMSRPLKWYIIGDCILIISKVIHKNAAARTKSRLSKAVKNLG